MNDELISGVFAILGVLVGSVISFYATKKLQVHNERLKAFRRLWKLLPSEEFIESCRDKDDEIIRLNVKGSLEFLSMQYDSKLAKRLLKLCNEIKSEIIEEGYDILLTRSLYEKVRKLVAEVGGWKTHYFRVKILGREPKKEWTVIEVYNYLRSFVEETRNMIKRKLL